jgi:hypothetical protein
MIIATARTPAIICRSRSERSHHHCGSGARTTAVGFASAIQPVWRLGLPQTNRSTTLDLSRVGVDGSAPTTVTANPPPRPSRPSFVLASGDRCSYCLERPWQSTAAAIHIWRSGSTCGHGADSQSRFDEFYRSDRVPIPRIARRIAPRSWHHAESGWRQECRTCEGATPGPRMRNARCPLSRPTSSEMTRANCSATPCRMTPRPKS